MKPSIVVVGSSNTDMVIQAEHLPAPGETILGGTFFMAQGGKGANQAVAAARLNGHVTFIAKIGSDVFGKQSLQLYKDEGIDTAYVSIDDSSPSGVALITVDNNGENCIAVAQGANGNLGVDDISKAQTVLENASIILMQLEIPLKTVAQVANIAESKRVRLVLNPAPARSLPDELLKKVSIITPNEKEAEMLTGIKISNIERAKEAARVLAGKGIETIIITMGAEGALVFHNNEFELVPGSKVKAVDTTAAGDVFNGALVVAISEGNDLIEAVRFANTAAAISVTRLGAQASAPRRSEAEGMMNANKLKV